MTLAELIRACQDGGPDRMDREVFCNGQDLVGIGDSDKWPGRLEITLAPPSPCFNCGRVRHDKSTPKCYYC